MTVNKVSLLSGVLGVFLSSSVFAMSTSATQLCTSGRCEDAKRVATPVALYERLGELFTQNTGRKIMFCDADPAIHLCFSQKLTVSASSPIVAANISIDAADMTEVKMSQEETSLTALLDMSVEANGTYPTCGTAQAKVVVGNSDNVSMVIEHFGCALTSTSMSDLTMGFAVDHIDFEKAVIGGYYTFSAAGSVHGMRSGYALLRFAEPVSGEFDGVPERMVETVKSLGEVAVVPVVEKEVKTAEKECAPCVAEKIRDDVEVRSAIEAAARAEAEAKAAADRAVKMAEEAAQTTSEYALKKAQEAENAKQEAEKAAEMAKVARSRVDNKVAAMSCEGEKKATVKIKTEQMPVVLNEIVEAKPAVAKTVTTKTTVIKHIDADGNVSEQVINEPAVSETITLDGLVESVELSKTIDKTQVDTPEVIVEVPSVSQTEETFPQKWNRWMDKASKVFWLEEPLF